MEGFLEVTGELVRRLSCSTAGGISVKSGEQVRLDCERACLAGSGPLGQRQKIASSPRSCLERTFWTGPDENTEF